MYIVPEGTESLEVVLFADHLTCFFIGRKLENFQRIFHQIQVLLVDLYLATENNRCKFGGHRDWLSYFVLD